MNWIRIATAISDDPRVHALAQRLAIRLAEAAGLLVFLLTKFPEHAPKGELLDVPDALLEKWAIWEGRRGRFAADFRALFLDERGVWRAWEKHNGAPLRDAASARKRMQDRRDALNRQGTLALESSPNGTANGTPNGSPYRSPLRTNERTNSSTAGACARGPATYGPGHLNVASAPWCAHCDGERVESPGSKRIEMAHQSTCPTLLSPPEVPTHV